MNRTERERELLHEIGSDLNHPGHNLNSAPIRQACFDGRTTSEALHRAANWYAANVEASDQGYESFIIAIRVDEDAEDAWHVELVIADARNDLARLCPVDH